MNDAECERLPLALSRRDGGCAAIKKCIHPKKVSLVELAPSVTSRLISPRASPLLFRHQHAAAADE